MTLGYGALGFVDDYLKLSRNNHKGVSARVKLIAQALIGLIAAVWLMLLTRGPLATAVTMPVFKEVLIPLGFGFPIFAHAGDDGRVERGEPDRRAGWACDRADDHLRRRVRADRLSGRQPHFRRLPATQPDPRRAANWRCSARR